MNELNPQPKAYLNLNNNVSSNNETPSGEKSYLDINLYSNLSDNNQTTQGYTGNKEVDDWLDTLSPEERQKKLEFINAPLTGKEVAEKRLKNRDYVPTIDEFKSLMEFKKTQDTEFLSGLGEAAMHIAGQAANAGEYVAKHPLEFSYKAPANLIESAFQGFRNFYGMLGESENPDSSLFKFKNLITGDGSIESQYEQYLNAIKFNNDTDDLISGKQTIVFDKDYISPQVVQFTSNFIDPTLLVGIATGGTGFAAKIASAIGQAERLAAFSAKASVIKGSLFAGTLKWGAGVPLEIIGGATRNTIDYALKKGASAFEVASGISAAEAKNYVKRVGFGTAVTDLGGYGVPIASELSQAYVGAGIASGFGEAINATVAQMEKQGYKRGALSFSRQALEESNQILSKGGIGLSKHAQNLLKVLDKADPFIQYGITGLEGAGHGMVVGGVLGYLNDKEAGMYAGMGAGMAFGAIGALGGRAISDMSGATKSMRYDIQAKMALEVMKEKNPANHEFFNLLKAIYPESKDQINKIIVSADVALPTVDWSMMNTTELYAKLKANGFDPSQYDGFQHTVLEDGTIKYNLDENGNKIRAVDEMGYELPTLDELNRSSGWIDKKNANGRTRIVVNQESLNGNVVPHEFSHGIFSELALKPEFKQRLRTHVLGEVDANGKIIKKPTIDLNSAKAFFNRYIDAAYSESDAIDRKALLTKALDEYYKDGKMNVMDLNSKTPFLENLVEEFGAYYWTQFIKGKPVDFLFKGGEMSFAQTMLESVKNGYIDLMKSEIERVNPRFRFNENAVGLNDAFLDKKGNRVRIPELDALMTDMVKAVMSTNRNGSFDFSSLSIAGQEAYVKSNGLERIVKKDSVGKYKIMSDKEIASANRVRGIEIYKAIDSLDPKLKVIRDSNGNVIGGLTKINNEYVGMLSDDVLDHIVATGHMSQAEASKIKLFQDIVLGKTKSNIVEMTYHGKSAQTTTGAVDVRVYGEKVPIKNRKVLVLGIDNVFRKNGTFSSKLTTMDWQVIETRGKNLWADDVVRQLWGDDRGAFEGDFFRYLENASKPKTDPTRINDFSELWTENGAMKRNVMHQFAGLGKQSDVPYANTPLTEIHWDINQSFMYLSTERASNIRLSNEKVTYNHGNAGHDISRNMMPSEMKIEKTPNGKVYKHDSGFRFIETDKEVRLYDAFNEEIGSFKNLDDAIAKAKQVYTERFPDQKPINSFDNLKNEVVKLNIEPKSAYIHRNLLSELKRRSPSALESIKTELRDLISVQKRILENYQKQIKLKNLDPENSVKTLHENNLMFHEKVLDAFEKENLKLLTEKELEDGLNYIDSGKSNGRKAWTAIDSIRKIIGMEWDEKYPMKFRSPLEDAIKSLFANEKDITAQALLKKLLRVGSSKEIQIWSEADAIGLIKFLKSKIKPTERVYRTINPETGELYPRGTPDAPLIRTYSGEQQIPLDKAEILKYLDDNKIILTIEENAKEVRGLQTERYTADGTRSGYRETALRINPIYQHDIIGHYNKAVAHLRTTDRIDAEGNRVNFGEEYQANNTDESANSNIQFYRTKAERAKKVLPVLKNPINLRRLSETETAMEKAAIDIGDKVIGLADVHAVVDNLLNQQGTKRKPSFKTAIQKASLNAEPNGGAITDFSEIKIINYAKSINGLIDAWWNACSKQLDSSNKKTYDSWLHELRDINGDLRTAIDNGVFSKENFKKYISFVRDNLKLDLNKSAEDIMIDIASHSITMNGKAKNLLYAEKKLPNGNFSISKKIIDAHQKRVKDTYAFLIDSGMADLNFLTINVDVLGANPLKMFDAILKFADIAPVDVILGDKNTSRVLSKLGLRSFDNPDGYLNAEALSRYMSFGLITFDDFGSVKYHRVNDGFDGLPYPVASNDVLFDFTSAFNHLELTEINRAVDKNIDVQEGIRKQLRSVLTNEDWEISAYDKPITGQSIIEDITDRESNVSKYNAMSGETRLPFMKVNEWGLHLIKMQIREAIQKGQRKITITHPDDAPTKSNMDKSRYALYGTILPNIARGFLKKYGIEVKQDLKLHSKLVSDNLKLYADQASITSNKMKSALEIFKEEGSGENSYGIQRISEELSTPVQELIKKAEKLRINKSLKPSVAAEAWITDILKYINQSIKSDKLKQALGSVATSKANEVKLYGDYLIACESSEKGKLKEIADAQYSEKTQTEYAIDRGHSFILNDEIIQAFLRNDEHTAMKQYMPKEKTDKAVPRVVNQEEHARMMAIVRAIPHLNDAYERGELTFDQFQHSKYRKYHVVSHGLDNASTVDWKDPDTNEVIFKAQGGGTYPAYRSPQGWATNMPSMADQINRVGNLNKLEHGEWVAPIMFIKSKDSKVGGSVNGSTGFINAFYALNKRGAIPDKVFKSALLSSFKDYFKEKGINVDKNSSIEDVVNGARKILADKKYPPFNDKVNIINAFNSLVYESVDYTNPFVEKFIPTVSKFKSNKRILVDDLKNAIFGMMSDPLFEHAKHIQGKGQGGEVYGMVMFNSEVEAKEGDYHDSYTHSIIKKDGTPVTVDILTTPIHPKDLIKNYVKEVKTNKDKSLKLDANGNAIYKVGEIGDKNWADKEAATGQKNLAAVHNKLRMPKEFKDGLRSLIDAVDSQSDTDKVPDNIKVGLGMLMQAIEKQKRQDEVDAGVMRGVQALKNAIDEQSDADKVPSKIRAGVKKLAKAIDDIQPEVKQPEESSNQIEQEEPKVITQEPEIESLAKSLPETEPVLRQNKPENITTRWRSYVEESTTDGNKIYRNAMNYVIIQLGNKYRIYNPYKTMIGVYSDLEEAKRRIRREEPKAR